MSHVEAVPETPEPWENGQLGRDCEQVEKAPPELMKEVEGALELQMISIRFQKQLIEELKMIADYRGMGYQPLIREVVTRFARAEMMVIARELQETEKARATVSAELEKRQTA